MTGPTRTPLSELLGDGAIRLGLSAADRFEAVRICGQALVDCGAVTPDYVDSMLEREHAVSTFIGEGVAIPHGTVAGKAAVSQAAMVVLGFPDGVAWDDNAGGDVAKVCIGIAAPSGGHVALVARLAEILLDSSLAERLRTATEPGQVRELFAV